MHHSVLTGVILLLLTSFLRVECGKDPLQRKAIETAQNEVVKSSEVTEIENSKTSVAEVEGGETLKNDTSATFSITVSTDSFSDAGKDGEKDLSAVPKPRPGMAYLTQFQTLLSQFLAFIGLRAQVERKHRGLAFEPENNEIGPYKDGLKTTLGAVMGRGECYQKVTCRAGKYLKTIKLKELILVILEKVTPSTWIETVRMLKNSAIHNDKCEYKCLD